MGDRFTDDERLAARRGSGLARQPQLQALNTVIAIGKQSARWERLWRACGMALTLEARTGALMVHKLFYDLLPMFCCAEGDPRAPKPE
jgi:hypothetical protein